ncbi:hypothetical protein LR48_Vigan07g100100 [Vigna angularis]|uniref:Uncharacterized protein n=1 Tax=Phaseolus angularis TaxID=3914 RepID=A0A0L9UXI6_PHAAN|nr:hypothetical protein LR48_Vigan07g100100 [Vigna angularis]
MLSLARARAVDSGWRRQQSGDGATRRRSWWLVVQTRFRVGKGGRRGRRSLLVEVATTALAIRFRAWRHCGRRNSSMISPSLAAAMERQGRDDGVAVVRRGLLRLDLPHPITVPGCVPFHGPIKAFKDGERGYPSLYPVRPIVQSGTWDSYSWLYNRVGVSIMVGEATRWFGFVCLFREWWNTLIRANERVDTWFGIEQAQVLVGYESAKR